MLKALWHTLKNLVGGSDTVVTGHRLEIRRRMQALLEAER